MSQRLDYNAASPAGMKALGAVHGYVHQSGLPSRLVDLVFLRVSQINGCAYCIDMHSCDLLKAGLPVEHLVLTAVWPEAGSIFSEQERAALAWAEYVTRLGDRGVPDSAFEAAVAVFDRKQLVDLTLAIGLMNAYNRLAISFRATPMALDSMSLTRSVGADKKVDLQPPILPAESGHGSSEPGIYVPCIRCRREIPLSAAVSREASDYVELFCGLDCYERWRNQSDPLRPLESLTS
jgi:AhpD family alkylhydroperoxidase